MTEFSSVQEISEKISEVKHNLMELRRDRSKAKRKQANSTDLQDKKSALAGLEYLMKENKKAFKGVSSDDERQNLVDRARELNLEIATLEKEIADFGKEVKSFDTQEKDLAKELNYLVGQEKVQILKVKIDEDLSADDSFEAALYTIETVFGKEFNRYGVFESYVFVENDFVRSTVKRVLSENFNEEQTNLLMDIASRKATEFMAEYADPDDDFNMIVGIYFTVLRAQIETITAFSS